jgi:hypothetical protein
MTVAVACNLSDGVVLGVDSAASIPVVGEVGKTYENAEKLFQVGERPIGVATYGLGVFGDRSIGSYLREFEVRDPDGVVSGKNHVAEVVEAMRTFFMHHYDQHLTTDDQRSELGLVVAGFSSGDYLSEVWHIRIPQHDESGSAEQAREQGNFGVHWWGASDPLQRYARGYDNHLIENLLSYFQGLCGRPFSTEEWTQIDGMLIEHSYGVYSGAMPIQEGIEYTRWLVEMVVNHYRFVEEQPTIVGGAANIGIVTYTGEEFRILSSKAARRM